MSNNFNIVTIKSPTYTDVVYKYLLNNEQLSLFNEITRNNTVMNLIVFRQLSGNGLLNKRYIDKTDKIKL